LYSLYKSNQKWPVKTDDFFPYAHRPHSFWTGYFTSRTALKDYVRRTNNFFQSVRQLSAFSNLNDSVTQDALGTLARALGVAQHHDGVSGTERQHVANDYAKRLSIGTDKCQSIIQNSVTTLINKKYNRDYSNNPLNVIYCSLLNITECLPIEGLHNFSVMIYNPLGQEVVTWMRVPVTLTGYTVFEVSSSQFLDTEVVTIYEETKQIPGRKSSATSMVLFKATLPPLGFNTYVLSLKSQSQLKNLVKIPKVKTTDNTVLKNEFLSAQFDSNGNLIQIDNIDSGLSTLISQEYCYYKSMPGNNSRPEFQASGAYIFRPDGDPICLGVQKFIVNEGKHYSEIHQIYNEWISQTIRLFEGSRSLSFDWLIGPIDVSDQVGKEIVIRFKSDLASKSTFYTDSNGREILKRVRDFRPTWNFSQTEPVSGNYFPINSRIFIRDETGEENARQLTLLTDRSQGGSSVTDGAVEIMLHRRLLYDDSLGVSEPLNEPGFDNKGLVVTGDIYLLLNSTQNSAKLHRPFAHAINTQPLVSFGILENDAHYDQIKLLSGIAAATGSLPENVHLLTLAQDFDSQIGNALIIRLEHFYELNEDPILSQPVTVDLMEFFKPALNIVGMTELALGANMDISELKERLVFDPETEILKDIENTRISDGPFSVTLSPMQIRTFRVFYLP
jgi:lysosomal alpha-mannosidase